MDRFYHLITMTQHAETKTINELKHELTKPGKDTIRVLILAQLCYKYGGVNPDSSRDFGEQSLALARKINFKRGKALALTYLGRYYEGRNNQERAVGSINIVTTDFSPLIKKKRNKREP